MFGSFFIPSMNFVNDIAGIFCACCLECTDVI